MPDKKKGQGDKSNQRGGESRETKSRDSREAQGPSRKKMEEQPAKKSSSGQDDSDDED